jgi:hypothetical protein
MRDLFSLTIAIVILTLTSCGQSNLDGQYIAIGVSPSSNAPIIGSEGSSCSDRIAYKMAAGASPIGTSVAKYYIFFSNFGLQWTSFSSYLTVTQVTATVTGSLIGTTPLVLQLDPTEVGSLLNSATNVVPAGVTGTDGTAINSSDANRNPTSSFADQTPCPFLVGGINLNTTTPPQTFNLDVEIEVDGFSTNSSTGDVANVRQYTYATAEYN